MQSVPIHQGAKKIMTEVITILGQVLIIFLIIGTGAILSKNNMIDKNGAKQITNLVVNVVTPSVIFMSFQTEYDPQKLKYLLLALIMSLTVYVVAIPLSMLLIKKRAEVSLTERLAVSYPNAGYMGIPLVSAIFGQEGVFYTSAVITVFNLVIWSVGVMTIQDKLSFAELKRVLVSPNIFAILLGLLCYIFRITIPYIPAQALSFFAGMNTPLAMLVSGVTVASANIFDIIKNKRIWLLSFYKLLLIPTAAALVLKLFNAPELVYKVVAVTAACPTASAVTLITLKYDKNAEYASQILTATTLLSVITLPIFALIL